MCREHSPLAQPPGDAELGWTAVERILDERRGSGLAEVIPSTKGEPLLWPSMQRLAAACAARGLALNVTTNGTWPRLGARRWAEVLVPVCSDVKLSWNGATASTAEAVMEGLDFDDALQGARTFLAVRDARGARCTVTFQVTAQERNVAELPAIVRIAADLGVARVKLNHLQVHFPALAAGDLRRDRAARARWNAALAAAREAAAAGGVRLEGAGPLDEGGAPPPEGPCPFLGAEAWVTADGRFAPCPAPAGLEGALGDFGSLARTTIAAVWSGVEYRRLCATYEDRAPCRGCAFRRAGGA
jgi:MoaA/NifB/PqqE/SkfB family radical SAM enzyme